MALTKTLLEDPCPTETQDHPDNPVVLALRRTGGRTFSALADSLQSELDAAAGQHICNKFHSAMLEGFTEHVQRGGQVESYREDLFELKKRLGIIDRERRELALSRIPELKQRAINLLGFNPEANLNFKCLEL